MSEPECLKRFQNAPRKTPLCLSFQRPRSRTHYKRLSNPTNLFSFFPRQAQYSPRSSASHRKAQGKAAKRARNRKRGPTPTGTEGAEKTEHNSTRRLKPEEEATAPANTTNGYRRAHDHSGESPRRAAQAL